MDIYDVNCFAGHWPFCFLRHQSIEEMIRIHRKAGIKGGAVGCLDSIFYKDPSEGDERFFSRLPEGYLPTLCIDPKLPAALEDIERFKPKAIRVYPQIHGYKLTDPILAPVCTYLQSKDIPLLIHGRLFVSREAHLIVPPEPDITDTVAFLKRYTDMKVVLLGYEKNELLQLGDAVRGSHALCDTSFVRSAEPERIAEAVGTEHLIFGSCHPLLCLESVKLTLEKANFSESEKKRIFSENYLKLFP